ncbi:hypothetical protein BU23DRAFT_367960, partial [Bimuria novae-zelandiae CBS 107.79]
EFLCDRRFHQIYILPPNPGNGRPQCCRISYADFGDRDSDAVVLLCGGLTGGRLAYSPLDQLAKKHKIRILHPDRFGIGASNSVPLGQRIQTWLELVPQLLAHLHIPHVSIASHSGGIVYALNTILTYPHLLSPGNRYVCFFAPWVHQSHSKLNILRVVALLPTAVIDEFACIIRVAWKCASLCGIGARSNETEVSGSTEALPLAAVHGINSTFSTATCDEDASSIDLDDLLVVEQLRRLIVMYQFAESTLGQSHDAQLFLKKPQSVSWSAQDASWSDVDDFVPLLSKIINEEDPGRTWMIDAFHAQNDNMVGEKGREWFDSCWT